MAEPTGNVLRCPKCPGTMRTYERNGVNLEQCDSCRGIFLDFGELESLSRLESQASAPPPPPQPQQHYAQQPPPPQPYPAQYQQHYQQPGYGGGHGYGHQRRRGFGGLFFSS